MRKLAILFLAASLGAPLGAAGLGAINPAAAQISPGAALQGLTAQQSQGSAPRSTPERARQPRQAQVQRSQDHQAKARQTQGRQSQAQRGNRNKKPGG